MRVVVTTEERLVRTPDGGIWTGGSAEFWQRYLTTFSRVRVVARVRDQPAAPPYASRISGRDVSIWPVPHYLGLGAYLRHRRAVTASVRSAAEPGDAVILRVPSAIGTILATHLDRARRPYALEVVGDPYDVFAPGAIRHPLRPVLRRWFVARLRRQCRRAVGVAYVTERSLQTRYPTGSAFQTHYSSIDLTPDAFTPMPRGDTAAGTPPMLISVGSLEQMYKGIDTLLRAVAYLAECSVPVRLAHLGGGRWQPWLRDLADQLGIGRQVTFLGAVPPGHPVRARLDSADLFVMPSRTEGLPRALIEAMARGLPVLGTDVGGIGELLPADCLVPPDDHTALATAIGAMVDNPARMAAASARNLARARDFGSGQLALRRHTFYQSVRDAGG